MSFVAYMCEYLLSVIRKNFVHYTEPVNKCLPVHFVPNTSTSISKPSKKQKMFSANQLSSDSLKNTKEKNTQLLLIQAL